MPDISIRSSRNTTRLGLEKALRVDGSETSERVMSTGFWRGHSSGGGNQHPEASVAGIFSLSPTGAPFAQRLPEGG
jgi:hypothetical protein